MILGPRMAAARKRKGLTQKELATKLDLATGTIQQYELGKRRPGVDVLKTIADILDVSVDALISTSEPEDEYELICDTLEEAGYNVEPTGFNRGDDADGDEYLVSYKDAENDVDGVKLTYSRLAKIVHQVLADAESKKDRYIQKLLDAELFGWKL